jgi:predicted transcriptional regulator
METQNLIMIKTQIQLPDELYRRVKAFAEQREWSLAKTFRRAVEQMFERKQRRAEDFLSGLVDQGFYGRRFDRVWNPLD